MQGSTQTFPSGPVTHRSDHGPWLLGGDAPSGESEDAPEDDTTLIRVPRPREVAGEDDTADAGAAEEDATDDATADDDEQR